MKTMDERHMQVKDEGKTFDMYHFFSRWDVLLAVAVILLLLAYALATSMFGLHHVAI